MMNNGTWLSRVIVQTICGFLFALKVGVMAVQAAGPSPGPAQIVKGKVESGNLGLSGYAVSLYGSFATGVPGWIPLGSTVSDSSGNFQISYLLSGGTPANTPVLFVEAVRGSAMLVDCIGLATTVPITHVVVNERTTVAAANAFAQFVADSQIQGNLYGMRNAAGMAGNLANPQTGATGIVLSSPPNGSDTSTYATFNSLANVVAACVAGATKCAELFAAATPPGQAAPTNVLQAMANIVKYPAYPGWPIDADDPVFLLSEADQLYGPALTHRPTSWLLFLKITGGFYSDQANSNLMDGPGTFAIDEKGFVWVNDNYEPQPPGHFACAGLRLLEFDPSGKPVPGTPFFGGGLSGAGWGLALDPQGNVWVGNFGFQDPPCAYLPQAAPSNSVSKFYPNGKAISPSTGYTEGNISWPMGTVSDRAGNIWIANCGNDTMTKYPGGNYNNAINIPLPLPSPPMPGNPQLKPFGIAIDLQGNIWVTGNRSSTVWLLSPQDTLLKILPGTYNGATVFSHPVGNAADSQGNIWVANSDWLDAPCPTRNMLGTAANPSITLIQASTQEPYVGSPFSGGGITLPWGVAVDGDDTVWVFNLGSYPPLSTPKKDATGISRFCGTNTSKCPAGQQHVGDPISPSTGYRSDAFVRITGGEVDPSGNIWMTGNWKIAVNPFVNPGENSVVIAIGAAGPVKTPVIGPPVPFQ